MQWLVAQMVLISHDRFNNINKMGMIIRIVNSDTKAEAIGKFMIETEDMVFERRIDPIECHQLTEVITID
jgi:hypothetical protein